MQKNVQRNASRRYSNKPRLSQGPSPRGRRLHDRREVETGKSVLHQYINGTVGFIKLGANLGRSAKVLMRMFSATGNPQARNLFEIGAHLQELEGTVLQVINKEAAETRTVARFQYFRL